MIVDCDSCVMREIACADCFVTALLDLPSGRPVDLDDEAAGALEVLAEAALVPPLRLVTAADAGATGATAGAAGDDDPGPAPVARPGRRVV